MYVNFIQFYIYICVYRCVFSLRYNSVKILVMEGNNLLRHITEGSYTRAVFLTKKIEYNVYCRDVRITDRNSFVHAGSNFVMFILYFIYMLNKV